MHVCLPCVCSTLGGQKGRQILWNWSHRRIEDSMWMLEAEPGSSAGEVSAPHAVTVSAEPQDF